jgi:hypothetical protein
MPKQPNGAGMVWIAKRWSDSLSTLVLERADTHWLRMLTPPQYPSPAKSLRVRPSALARVDTAGL